MKQLYGTSVMLTEKTIVCWHRPARLGHMFDPSRAPDESTIFCGDGGGRIVAEGSPEEVAEVEGSYTGQYLKKWLQK